MAADLLKFRCYRCNQLLAVAPGKAGSVVSCPKCKAELQVPSSELPAKADAESRTRRQAQTRLKREDAGSGAPGLRAPKLASDAPPLPSFMEEIAHAIPP